MKGNRGVKSEKNKRRDDRRHKNRTDIVHTVDSAKPRRWQRPRRRVKSMDHRDSDGLRQIQHRQRAAGQVDRASSGNLDVHISSQDDGELGVPWRTVSLPAGLPGVEELGLQACEPVKENEVLDSEEPEAVIAPDVETPRVEKEDSHPPDNAIPQEEEQCKDTAAQAKLGDAPQLDSTDKQELLRLQQLAEEFMKVKAEKDKLQEDLSKHKRLNKNLRKENRRLFRKQNSGSDIQLASKDEDDDPLQQHVIQQLQSLQVEKAKLVQENCQLSRDNESLHELLQYARGDEQGYDSCSDDEIGLESDIIEKQKLPRIHVDARDECMKGDMTKNTSVLFDTNCFVANSGPASCLLNT